MTEKELLELIRRGENQTVEFKRSFATEDKIVEELASFANTFGGTVIVGVRDVESYSLEANQMNSLKPN